MKFNIDAIKTLLESPKKVFIITHFKPDGDAIGSTLALALYLTKKGHTTTIVVPSEVPDFLHWMPHVNSIIDFIAAPKNATDAIQNSDLIFGLDFNDFSRTKGLTHLLTVAHQPKILIDHHLYPSENWDNGLSDPNKSSTCEMVYDFINLMGDNNQIDAEIATCIYTGIMTDTGSFRFPATTASVHSVIADLLKRPINHTQIHEAVYDSWTENRMRFIGHVLTHNMEIFSDFHSGLITIAQKDLYKFQLQTGDTEGLVNYPLNIAQVKFATLITERNNEVKLSFRSKGDFNVNEFARKYFNGGGHFNASGGSSFESFNETILRFKEKMYEFHP